MRIISTLVRKLQSLDTTEPIQHWYGTTYKKVFEHSYVDTYEYEVTELSNELQTLVDAMNKKCRGYSISELDKDILKAKDYMIMIGPQTSYIGIGDGWYDMTATRNSLKFVPYNNIGNLYQDEFVPFPKRDNADFIQQRLLELEKEIKYVIKLHNNYKTI